MDSCQMREAERWGRVRVGKKSRSKALQSPPIKPVSAYIASSPYESMDIRYRGSCS